MIKYETGGYGKKLIEEVECEKDTAKSVWIAREITNYAGEKKRIVDPYRKSSRYKNYFDTWEDAHKSLLKKAEDEVNVSRRKLELANSAFVNIKGLKPRP